MASTTTTAIGGDNIHAIARSLGAQAFDMTTDRPIEYDGNGRPSFFLKSRIPAEGRDAFMAIGFRPIHVDGDDDEGYYQYALIPYTAPAPAPVHDPRPEARRDRPDPRSRGRVATESDRRHIDAIRADGRDVGTVPATHADRYGEGAYGKCRTCGGFIHVRHVEYTENVFGTDMGIYDGARWCNPDGTRHFEQGIGHDPVRESAS